jgi:hypothetical protein
MLSEMETDMEIEHASVDELNAGLPLVRQSPAEEGRLELIVARPSVAAREVLASAVLDGDAGPVGDSWSSRGSTSTEDGSAEGARQLTVMNHRVASLVARRADRVPLAGDQLYVDFDLSVANAPPGTQLAIAGAVIELTEPPHTGCAKFTSRFGLDALRFVNSPEGRKLRLRGANAKVVVPGVVAVGDQVRKV